MGFDASSPKRLVTMTLNEDLIRRVRQRASYLFNTVERLLIAF